MNAIPSNPVACRRKSQGSWFYRVGGAVTRGPVSAEQLRELIRTGKLRPTDRISKDGRSWHDASRLKGIRWPAASEPLLSRDEVDVLRSERGSWKGMGWVAGGVVANLLSTLAVAGRSDYAPLAWVCAAFAALTVLGALLIPLGARKLGAVLVFAGCIPFIPLGLIGMVGAQKVLDD